MQRIPPAATALALIVAAGALLAPRAQAQSFPFNQPVTYQYQDNNGFGSITLTNLGADPVLAGGSQLQVSIFQNGFSYNGSGFAYQLLPNSPHPGTTILSFSVVAADGTSFFFEGAIPPGGLFQGQGTYHPTLAPGQNAAWSLGALAVTNPPPFSTPPPVVNPMVFYPNGVF